MSTDARKTALLAEAVKRGLLAHPEKMLADILEKSAKRQDEAFMAIGLILKELKNSEKETPVTVEAHIAPAKVSLETTAPKKWRFAIKRDINGQIESIDASAG